MKVKGLLIATLVLVAAMVGFALWVAAGLPPGAELPTHWNAAGEVDDTQPALQALLFPAGLALLLGGLFAAIPSLEPLQEKLEASAPVLRVAWIGLLAVMIGTQLMIAGPALGWSLGVNFLFVVLGLLFVALGNVLPKPRPGFFVGIRTPWTIVDTDNWVATDRLGGKLMILAGLVIVVSALLPVADAARLAILLVVLLAAALVPVAYSWWLWRQASGGNGRA
jgi:uncharacterized membrane protein